MTKIYKGLFKTAIKGTGGIMLSIANNLKCSREAVYKYCAKHEDMALLRDQEKEKILDIAENSLFRQAKEGEQWATKYLLATQGKKRGYVEKQEIESTHKGEGFKLIIESPNKNE